MRLLVSRFKKTSAESFLICKVILQRGQLWVDSWKNWKIERKFSLQCCKLRFQFWQSKVAIEQIQPAAVNLTDILCPRPVKLGQNSQRNSFDGTPESLVEHHLWFVSKDATRCRDIG
jgi:hypothetical protein